MRRLCLAALILFVLTLPSLARARDITVAAWNVENLFDTRKDTDNPGEPVLTGRQLDIKLSKTAEVVRYLEADIVGLIEVENRGLLRTLCAQYLAGDGFDHFMLVEETDPRGIDVALISKLPFTAYSFETPGHTRGLLACRFTHGGEPFYVLVNHWKSRIDGGDEIRMACARRAVELVEEVLPGYEGKRVPVLVMGDLNDDDGDPSVVALEQAGLVNLLKALPPGERWTYPWYNSKEKRVQYHGFDHVLVSPEMLDRRGVDVVPKTARVVRPDFMLRKRKLLGMEWDWIDNTFLRHIGYSDHFPVSVRVRLPE